MSLIHPSAFIDPAAHLDEGVTVGAFAVVESGAKVGAGTSIGHHAVIHSNVLLGRRNQVFAHAVVGGMALDAHGFRRLTVDVDILVSRESLKTIHERLEGLGYVPPFAGSKNLRDTESGVRIEFLIAGEFPGDGKPKPVAFPNPATVAVEIDGVKYLSLASLVDLKLASGMTNLGRLKDLGDVQELIKTLDLPRAYSEQLNPYVQPKYFELWDGIQASPEHPSDR